MIWARRKLSETCSLITDGKHGDCHNQENSGYYFISAKDIQEWKIEYKNARQITKSDFDETHQRTKLEPFDVVVVSTGAYIGDVAIAREEEKTFTTTFQKSVAILKPIKKILYPYYLAYYLSNSRDRLHSVSSGSAQKNLLLKDLRSFEIDLPDLIVQQKIASILSAYDDLIENNLKQIKLLEEAAQNIYKEWFVKFRFHGYEVVEFEDGLPLGWREGKVGDLCQVKSGFAFKSKDWQERGNPVIKITNINNNTVNVSSCDCIRDEIAESANNFKIISGDLIIAMTGATVGKVGLMPRVDKHYYVNQRVGLFKTKSEHLNNTPLLFSFFLTSEALVKVLNLAGGAAQPNISAGQIESISLCIPTIEILNQYSKILKPMLEQIITLYQKNQKLKEARDILLPRLMNRTIEV